jgi:hypothetical protein
VFACCCLAFLARATTQNAPTQAALSNGVILWVWFCREAGGEAGATAHSEDSSSSSTAVPAAVSTGAAAEAKGAAVTKQDAGKQGKSSTGQQQQQQQKQDKGASKQQQQEQQAVAGGMASFMQDMFGLVYRSVDLLGLIQLSVIHMLCCQLPHPMDDKHPPMVEFLRLLTQSGLAGKAPATRVCLRWLRHPAFF